MNDTGGSKNRPRQECWCTTLVSDVVDRAWSLSFLIDKGTEQYMAFVIVAHVILRFTFGIQETLCLKNAVCDWTFWNCV